MIQRKVLVLFAHPTLDSSAANAPLFRLAQQTAGVTVIDLYAEYPKHHIDVEREQQRLLEHDVIIFQFPMFWYSTPALLKEWQDLVLEYGFAYGTEGTALKKKLFMCSLTAGGARDAYGRDGQNQFTITEFLRPLQQMASLCQMHYLPPLVLFGSRSAKGTERLDEHPKLWHHILYQLQHTAINPNANTADDLMNGVHSELFTVEGHLS